VSETGEGETDETIPVPNTAVTEASVQAETGTESAEPSKETPPLEDNLAALAETSEQASTESTEISDVWTSTPEAEPESSGRRDIEFRLIRVENSRDVKCCTHRPRSDRG